jgi:hypothetical protein
MTTQLTDNYPKIIRDFFHSDSGVSDGSAHAPIDLPFEYSVSDLLCEAQSLPYDDREVNRCYVWGPTNRPDPGCDLVTDYGRNYSAQIDLTKFPAIGKFLHDCQRLGPVTYMTFKRMGAKGYIMPHIDSECNPYKIYVPLSWPEGSRFKVYCQGEVDFTGLRPNIIATSGHMHSVINDSVESRIIFSFYVDWSSPGWSNILKKSKVI